MNRYTETEIEKLLASYRFQYQELDEKRLSNNFVTDLIEKIEKGQYRDIDTTPFKSVDMILYSSEAEEKKLFEYSVVISISRFCQAAIAGGVNTDEAYDLSDVLYRKVARAKDIAEIRSYFSISAILFAKMVSNRKKQEKPYAIEQCKLYISRNIFKKITLEDISVYTGLSTSYISHIFKDYEGISVYQYIQREKTHVACNMLTYSDSSIAEIAQYIGFKSQSNFSEIFKKWQHLTPTEYRNRNYENTFSDPYDHSS